MRRLHIYENRATSLKLMINTKILPKLKTCLLRSSTFFNIENIDKVVNKTNFEKLIHSQLCQSISTSCFLFNFL